uniref:Dephospho-CoA kinase n=1 Tax=Salix viminalis TaxID=40686 RepID=A0A6N2M6E3_SALVM
MAASQASLLLQKQLRDLCKKPVDGFSAGLVDESDVFEWSVSIMGPPDTLYEGGFFNAIMSFPKNYPNSPPTIRFTSEMWHPNVYPDGKVCISILHPPGDDPNGYELATERWTPVHTVESIILSIISMLSSPNDESPANVDAANPVDGFSAGLIDENNVFEWSVTIIGPPDTLYEGGFFNAIMSFPQNYPVSPPTVRFTSEVWHPNVYANGKVCISILHPPGDDPNGYELATERWTPVHTVESIVLSIISMLSSPNDESPANVDAAKQWRENRNEFKKRVSRCVRKSQEIMRKQSFIRTKMKFTLLTINMNNDKHLCLSQVSKFLHSGDCYPGGISSGKSTASNLFKSHDIPVVDADIVARDVLKKDTGGYKGVVAAFGDDILQANGEVDRPKLGQIVFSDPGKRQLLNRLLAPYISSGIWWEILRLWLKGYKVIVLDIPLLFEAKMDKWTKPIVVVWVDTETQLQRLMARDRINEEDARNRIKAQMSLDLKRSQANIVIDNSGSLEDLEEQFQKVLVQVTRPLTWSEFWLSRQGTFSALVSTVIGVAAGKNVLSKL